MADQTTQKETWLQKLNPVKALGRLFSAIASLPGAFWRKIKGQTKVADAVETTRDTAPEKSATALPTDQHLGNNQGITAAVVDCTKTVVFYALMALGKTGLGKTVSEQHAPEKTSETPKNRMG